MSNNVNAQLHDLLVTKNFNPEILNLNPATAGMDKGNQVLPNSDQAFSFKYNGPSKTDYGTVLVMLKYARPNDPNAKQDTMTVMYSDNLAKSMETEDKDSWFNFLYQLRQLAKRNRFRYDLQDLNKLKYSLQGQSMIKEGLLEGWHGTKTASWNGTATEARLMIKHKKIIGENDARFRYIESLFVETADGERYKLPFSNLSGGRAMVEHVRQGGKPYDVRGQHIVAVVNEMNLLSRFRRASQHKIFEGDTAELVTEATVYHEKLQHNLRSLSTSTGYKKYFESWDPAVITDEDVIIEDLRHMFVETNIDSRIEQALPLLAKLKKQDTDMKEANIFESWMNLLAEGTWALPDTKEKQTKLVALMGQELPVGADATNATEQLYELLGDDELFDKLHDLADQDADADARTVIIDRLEQLKGNPDIAQVIGQLKIEQPNQAQPAPDAAAEETDELTEISDELKHRYKAAAHQQISDLEQDADGEYGDIAQRMIDRRKRGLELAGDEEELNEYNIRGFEKGNYVNVEGFGKGVIIATDVRSDFGTSSKFQGITGPKYKVKWEGSNGEAVVPAAKIKFISSMTPKARELKKGIPFAAEDRTETRDETGKITSWRDDSAWHPINPDKDPEGKMYNLSDRARRETEKLKDKTDETSGGGNWLEDFDDEYVNVGGDRVKNTPADKLAHAQKTFPNVEKVDDNGDPVWDETDADNVLANESTSLQGQYGHSGKMQVVVGHDQDMVDRLQALAGIRSNDTSSESNSPELMRMRSLAGILIRP
jgi:uncharacterized protein YihD (DUF1040 family)